jgi:hypothetical protein
MVGFVFAIDTQIGIHGNVQSVNTPGSVARLGQLRREGVGTALTLALNVCGSFPDDQMTD